MYPISRYDSHKKPAFSAVTFMVQKYVVLYYVRNPQIIMTSPFLDCPASRRRM